MKCRVIVGILLFFLSYVQWAGAQSIVDQTVLKDLPLRSNMTTCKSSKDVPEIKELIGVWRGKWDNPNRQNTALVVRCVDTISVPAKAKIYYGYGYYDQNKAGWSSLSAEYVPGKEPILKWNMGTNNVQFTLKKGKMEGSYRHGGTGNTNYTTMEKTSESLNPKVVFSEDGKKMILFPGPREVDLSGVIFDLAGIPNDFRFMVGKVYRGQFRYAGKQGALAHIFLTKWTKEGIEIAFINDKARANDYSVISCPPVPTSDFTCVERWKGGKLPSISYRWLTKDGKPAIDKSDGYSAEFEEVELLPSTMLAK
ncbi:MAG: hypothetical protein NTX36_09525 [Proteobacteria bacterium]|nr:hypothetical protein [Pseudomonadota bacterium]